MVQGEDNNATGGYTTHGVDGRIRVNLKCVDVICGVLEQAIVRIKHLVT